ncbi:diacylglycerol/lipid kinase family protein [Gracilimonas sp.]|uniref:diacylglycerol/lipid kinase family protein n=1 Tax=Gracilimonas sp. TaxID=1974203 RepID=UPI0028726490|nr:YegS/Rv2252/BmrU family lipid kinase [Gracilimonas sp.]
MNRNRTYCFLINCSSNAGRSEELFRSKEAFINSNLAHVEFIYIDEEDSISEIAAAKAKEYSHIVACGGDGTVNQVANGIIETDSVMGVLPLGSGNDFAQNIGLNHNFEQNFDTLLNNFTTNIDSVQSEWGYFVNTFGIGVDGLTNFYSSKSRIKNGKYKYFFGGLKALLLAKPFNARIKIPELKRTLDQKIWMVTIANGKTEGGKYKISPGSINNDGEVEIIMVRNISRIELLIEFIKLSLGYSFRTDVVKVLSTSLGCSVNTEFKTKAHADGEQAGDKTSYNFKVSKSALSVVVNPDNYNK